MEFKKLIATTCWFLMIFTCAHAQEDLSSILAQADQEYASRDGSGGHARLSLELCRKALEIDPDSFDANWRAARACFWICDRTEDEEIKKEFGMKGKEYGQRAIDLEPDRVEGYYYYTINLGEYGQGISIVKAVFQGLDKDYREHGSRAVEIDPKYEHGAPLRAMGRFYFKLPWPKYSAKKSEEYLIKALDAEPNKVRTRIYLADLYEKEKRFKDALTQLEEIERTEPLPDDVFENGFYKEQARKMAAEIKKKLD